MQSTIQLNLLNETIALPELTIGQAMDIAKIPERYNEKRLSALIAHLTDDASMAKRLTVQERYYVLLNHLSIADNKYAPTSDYESFFIPGDTPQTYGEMGVTFHHLLGWHVELLEAQCENVYDWLAGQLACQLSGDFSDLGINWQWAPLNAEAIAGMSAQALNEHLQARFKQISDLTEYQFNQLADMYYNGVEVTAHFLDISIDNQGINILGGDGGEPARFRPLAHLRGLAADVARCFIA